MKHNEQSQHKERREQGSNENHNINRFKIDPLLHVVVPVIVASTVIVVAVGHKHFIDSQSIKEDIVQSNQRLGGAITSIQPIDKDDCIIGTLVKLNNQDDVIMITGYCQEDVESLKVYDFAGVVCPDGYLGSKYNQLFNYEDIEGKVNVNTNSFNNALKDRHKEIQDWANNQDVTEDVTE